MKHPPKSRKSKKRPVKHEKASMNTRPQKQIKYKEESESNDSEYGDEKSDSERPSSNDNYDVGSSPLKLKKNSRQENSLGELTKNFINYVRESGKNTININDLVRKLKVKKRRIYDITNVLEGIGYIKKHAKNEISWIKNEYFPGQKNKKFGLNNSSESYSSDRYEEEAPYIGHRIERFSIENWEDTINKYLLESRMLEQKSEQLAQEFENFSNRQDFKEYGYVTVNDLKKMSLYENLDLLVIKAPKGTFVDIINPKDAKEAYEIIKGNMATNKMEKDELLLDILKKEHHLFLESPAGKIVIHKVSKDDHSIFDLTPSNIVPILPSPAVPQGNTISKINMP